MADAYSSSAKRKSGCRLVNDYRRHSSLLRLFSSRKDFVLGDAGERKRILCLQKRIERGVFSFIFQVLLPSISWKTHFFSSGEKKDGGNEGECVGESLRRGGVISLSLSTDSYYLSTCPQRKPKPTETIESHSYLFQSILLFCSPFSPSQSYRRTA